MMEENFLATGSSRSIWEMSARRTRFGMVVAMSGNGEFKIKRKVT